MFYRFFSYLLYCFNSITKYPYRPEKWGDWSWHWNSGRFWKLNRWWTYQIQRSTTAHILRWQRNIRKWNIETKHYKYGVLEPRAENFVCKVEWSHSWSKGLYCRINTKALAVYLTRKS